MNYNEIIEFNMQNVTIGLSEKGYGHTYLATHDLKKGDKIMQCYGKIINHQTAHLSMQIGYGCHFLPEKWTGKNLNHSCEPNAYVQTTKHGFPALHALRPIKQGEEITCQYSMTEHSWGRNCRENHVQCLCGAATCKGKILSFSQLSRKEQEMLLNNKYCADYLGKNMSANRYRMHSLETIHIPAAGVYVAA